ncbi:MAG TPA: MarR family transcriptional regulator [Actinomycetota bacterium]|nr:MarR family transcriptional regulator [Actinomycetota bacterium]
MTPDDGLLPAERKVLERLGHLPLDFRAMGAISNVFRTSATLRRHLEAEVLAPDRLSWTAFTGLWVLWVWGEMEAADFAEAVGISRPTATGVLGTLEHRGWLARRGAPHDKRRVLLRLTDEGETKIAELFPRFNAAESALVSGLRDQEQERLASMLRMLVRSIDEPSTPS